MHVAEIWRYPVKSLAGERIAEADVRADGIPGDRAFQVRRANGRIVDARAHPKMLALHPTLTPADDLLVDGRAWDSPEVARAVEEAAAVGPGAHLERRETAERFDVLPLLVATDGAIAAFGYDYRRLRPNILLGGVEGLAERDWEGGALQIGGALIGVLRLRGRCVMTTWDPDTQQQNPAVFQHITECFDGKLALDCWVICPGRIRVGDTVTLVDRASLPPDAAARALPSESDWGRYASESARTVILR